MVQSVQARVRDALARARLTGSRTKLVAAVSGGADSMCLLDAVLAARLPSRPNVLVAHVDHNLRPDSAEDADHVASTSAGYGLPCEVMSVDVPALAKSERRGLEDAARVGRYRALSGLARRVRASAILTGHTRSDSVETMLLHLLRGSGPRGLRGIEPSERLDPALVDGVDCLGLTTPRVVRPLLDVDRADTAAYCTARGIEWRTDPTNGDLAFTRNRVRHHLLPVLRTYNPAIDAGLERLAQMARDEEHWIDGLVERAFVRLGRQEPVGVAFEIGAWRRQLLALRRRLVLRVADRYGIDDVGFDAVERALAVAEEHGPPRTELGNRLEVERTGNQIVFRLRRGNVG